MKRGESIYVGSLRIYVADVKNDLCEIFVSYAGVNFGSATVSAAALESLQKEQCKPDLPGIPGNEIDD